MIYVYHLKAISRTNVESLNSRVGLVVKSDKNEENLCQYIEYVLRTLLIEK